MKYRFKEHFYNEAKIISVNDRNRDVLARPKMTPIPEDLQGKRLVTIVNTDQMYYTIVFEPNTDEPLLAYYGSYDKPLQGVLAETPPEAEFVYRKHYKPQQKGESNPTKYGGEVKIRPPFIDYEEDPQDIGFDYFDDFENPNSVYRAGEIISDKLKKEK